jgi:hypothetical protein
VGDRYFARPRDLSPAERDSLRRRLHRRLDRTHELLATAMGRLIDLPDAPSSPRPSATAAAAMAAVTGPAAAAAHSGGGGLLPSGTSRSALVMWIACLLLSNWSRTRMRPAKNSTSSDGFLLNLASLMLRIGHSRRLFKPDNVRLCRRPPRATAEWE